MNRTLFVGVIAAVLVALPARAGTVGLPRVLDPRLAGALAPGSAPVGVWVEFVDKGEQGPADRVARLARAEAALSPECRARRARNRVAPLVDERDLPVAPEYLAAIAAAGLEPYGVSRWFNACAVRASGAALARLAALDCVRALGPAPVGAPRGAAPIPGAALPSGAAGTAPGADRAAGTQVAYGMTAGELARLHVPALHDSGYTGSGILVCMFDDGFNFFDKHEATRGIDVGGRTRDFVRGGTDVQDTVTAPGWYQHGQWTLSCIGGNAPGRFVGPAFGARYALARTEDAGSEKPIEMVNWLMAAEWADTLGADIFSSSLGYFAFPDSAGTSLTYPQLDGHTSIITRAVEIAAAKGILVVSSAGNGGPGPLSLDAPADACGDSMLAVGAVDSTGLRAGFSSAGPTADGRIKPDVMAQGVAVLVASASGTPGEYFALAGTSFSCPLTAGVAACLMQARPSWTIVDVVHALEYTATAAATPNNAYGHGIIDALAALRWDMGPAPRPGGPAGLELASANPMRGGGEPARFALRPGAGEAGSRGRVDVLDVLGRRVRSLWNGPLVPPGPTFVSWDGTDDDGRAVRSGLYFVTFSHGDRHDSVRLARLR